MLDNTQPGPKENSDLSAINPHSGISTDPQQPGIIRLWERLRNLGLGDTTLRFSTALLTLVLILAVVGVMNRVYFKDSRGDGSAAALGLSTTLATPTPTLPAPEFAGGGLAIDGILRNSDLHTILPIRQSRYDVIQYTVETGDSIFSIADKFNLHPESILWGNRYTLGDDPHLILPGQVLNILPVDGVYHQWSAGEGLNGVATVYGVTPEDIIDWPGNNLDADEIGDYANPNIAPDTMLIVPGGKGTYNDLYTPRISRDEPATAKNLGPGACTASYDGVTGSLIFMWPTTERYLSGYDYSPETNHFGIDIAGDLGNPIYAADNGVVVYAGWNDYGYGEMIVIDHGSGWQTLYAHLSQVSVTCGQEVYKAETIGLMGSTGVSTGPHLHFEMRSDDYGRVNPWNFLQ